MPPAVPAPSCSRALSAPGGRARARRYFHDLHETILEARCRRGVGWRGLRVVAAAGLGLGVAAGFAASKPEPVSGRWWRFDESAAAVAGAVLADAGPGGLHLSLGSGAAIVPGRVGGALRPGAAAGQPPAWCERQAGVGLSASDWTLTFSLWLDRDADAEGVILETGMGLRERGELVQRVSILPRENALVFSAPAVDPGAGAVGRRVEFSRPDGPPHGVALVQSVTLGPSATVWPRAEWLQLALVYDASAGQLRLLRDGQVVAVAAIRLEALPAGPGYLAVGGDGRGGRPLRGAIDELRIYDGANVPGVESVLGGPRTGFPL